MTGSLQTEREFLISVIVPVYKTEEYVEETIRSVLDQTIGFKKNIQLILVNNATPDNAGEICKQYRDRYPRNIVYVEVEVNRGPSSGRNGGIPYIRGKYVNFLDSDDKWETSALDKACQFLESHEDITCVMCRKRHFDASEDFFYDDGIFSKTRIVDIFSNPDYTQFHMCAMIFRSDVIQRNLFDEDSPYTEDTKLVSEILLKVRRYGLVREALFRYRKRKSDNSSQTSNLKTAKYWYTGVFARVYLHLMDLSRELYGEVIPYIQYVCMKEMRPRIQQFEFPEDFTSEDIENYTQNVKNVLLNIDDYVIQTVPHLYKEYKIACLKLKYGKEILSKFIAKKDGIYFHNLKWMGFKDNSLFSIIEHHVEENAIVLDGKISSPFPKEDYDVYMIDNHGNVYSLKEYDGSEDNWRYALNGSCLIRRNVRTSIPLKNLSRIDFLIRWGNIERRLHPSFGKFSRLNTKYNNNYCIENGYIFKFRDSSLYIEHTAESSKKYENQIRREIRSSGDKKTWILRRLYTIIRKILNGKRLWILLDRPMKSGDNAEYFFRYLNAHPMKHVFPVFVLSKKSPDFQRMKKYGKVIAMESNMYQLAYLIADKIISSTWGGWIDPPFGKGTTGLADLLERKYIYLDHALTKDDISMDVNKHKRNFSMWTTAAKPETKSILEFPYGYEEHVPKETGLARYDAIFPAIRKKPEKCIMLAPTWRKNLVKRFDKNGNVEYNTNFKESEYFQFYQNLMRDDRLLGVMREKGYHGTLKLHPIIQSQSVDFAMNDVFSLHPATESYEQEFFDTALIVTDYSSIAMDFAYAKRAIIYAQFDKENFYKTHSYHESWFDYEADGFGPVCYDYESTVRALMDAIEHDCKMEEKYVARRNGFFTYIDDRNCERICKAVMELG